MCPSSYNKPIKTNSAKPTWDDTPTSLPLALPAITKAFSQSRWRWIILLTALSAMLFPSASHAALIWGPYIQLGTPNSMIIRWREDVPNTGSVAYGRTLDGLTNVILDSQSRTDHCVSITGLTPDTKYFYSVSNNNSLIAKGEDCYFITNPTNDRPIRIWAIGDPQYGGVDGTAVRNAYYNLTGTNHTDLCLIMGDLAYWEGSDQEFRDYFFAVQSPLLRHTVALPTLGNHDVGVSKTDPPYIRIFNLPTQGEAGGLPSGTPFYYSFNYGNVHIISLYSILGDLSPSGPMYQWLEQDLIQNTQKWVIAFWHYPPYSKANHDSDYEFNSPEMREVFVPLLESHGVDLVLSGHCHGYERSYLLNGHYGLSYTLTPEMKLDTGNGRPDEDGPYVKGSACPTANQGAVYVQAGNSTQVRSGPYNHPAMYYSSESLGSLVIDIDDNVMNYRFLRENGNVDDYFQLIKGVGRKDFIITPSLGSDNNTTLTWKSVPGQIFKISRRTSLSAPWTPLATLTATSMTTTFTDNNTPKNGAFYRVEN